MIDGGMSSTVVETGREVIVHSPAGISHHILKSSFRFYIVLCHRILAHVTAALSLTGQETDPFQFPVLGTMVASIFNMIPYTKADFQQFIPAAVGIVDTIPFSAQLNPPKIVG